jgi:hypothetical protein
LFDYTQPADAPGQPRLAQIGLIFVGTDMKIEAEHEFLIKPEGWEMHAEAVEKTGLTTAHLKEHGVPIAEALRSMTPRSWRAAWWSASTSSLI